MGLIWSLIFGAIAGFIATGIMQEKSSWIKNILLGIVGGLVGGLVFSLVGFSAHGLIANLLVSVVGACICIWIGRKLF
jgi:uncharacterized membrane protein YeaQ/YmgE (transglycosylase-associated protein family)